MPNGETNKPFSPVPPDERVLRFLKERQSASWRDALKFLAETYPPEDRSGVSWILEGGAAVALLSPGQRETVGDLDLITRDSSLAKAINAGIFSPSVIAGWCTLRGLSYNRQLGLYIFNSSHPVEFAGREVRVLKPEILALTKSGELSTHQGSRRKDHQDLILLGVGIADRAAEYRMLRSLC